jgi:hypothetical protein
VRYGFVLPFVEARQAAELAREAEACGWDGVFVADAVWGIDPWVTLAAAAMTTERIRLGTMLTPVSRRRPWKLASETATLDNLCDGRLILAAGLGAPDTGFAEFGEVTDRRTRAELLDEGLDILTGLWAGQPFSYEGKHYHVRPTQFFPPPAPVQQPRTPIWVVGAWYRERSMERSLRYDGLLPNVLDEAGNMVSLTPEKVREMRAHVDEQKPGEPFDIVIEGTTPGEDPERGADEVRPYAEAGATWWLESMWEGPNSPGELRNRIRGGPPKAR